VADELGRTVGGFGEAVDHAGDAGGDVPFEAGGDAADEGDRRVAEFVGWPARGR
jgi:hypothetical protein